MGASTYYATSTDTTTGPAGDDFNKTLSATAPGSGSVTASVRKNATETQYLNTQSPDPNETSWNGNYSYVYDNETASADAHLTVSFLRINSSGTVVETKASDTGETTLSSATAYTFNLSSATWTSPAASDLFGIKLDLRNSHTKDAYSMSMGLPGSYATTPWGITEYTKTLTGGARVSLATTPKTLTGGARVKATITDTLTGGARLSLATTPKTLTGGSRVKVTGTDALTGGCLLNVPYFGFLGAETGGLEEFTADTNASVVTSSAMGGAYHYRMTKTTTGVAYGRMSRWWLSGAWTVFDADEIYTNFRFKIPSGGTPAANSEECFSIHNGTAQTLMVRLRSDRKLEVYDSDGFVATGSTVLDEDATYWIGVRGQKGTSGAYEVQIDGSSELSGTCNQLSATLDLLYFGALTNRNGESCTFDYDDIVASPDGFATSAEVRVMVPNADGNYTGWTNDYTTLDDIPIVTAAQISSATNLLRESVGLESASSAGINQDILAVAAWAYARAGHVSESVRPFIRVGSTDYDGGFTFPGTSYGQVQWKVWETNPADGEAWETTDLDSLEVGVQQGDNGYGAYAAAVFAMVLQKKPTTHTKTLTGGARVKTTTSDALQGGARVKVASTDALTGGARVKTTGTAALAGGLLLSAAAPRNLFGAETAGLDEIGGTNISVITSTSMSGAYHYRCTKTGTGAAYGTMTDYDPVTSVATASAWGASELYVNFKFRIPSGGTPSSSDEEIWSATSSSLRTLQVRLNSSGQLVVYDKDASVVATSTTTLDEDTVYWIGIRTQVGTSGAYELQIDDESELSGTCNQQTVDIEYVYIGSRTNRNGQSMTVDYDDVVVSYSEFTPRAKVLRMAPNAAGYHTGWTGDYQDIDEIPISTSDTISTSATYTKESWGYESSASAGISGTIYAVKQWQWCDRTSSKTAKVFLRQSSTDYTHASYGSLPGTWGSRAHVWSTDPSTGSAWTTGGLDTVEGGVETGDGTLAATVAGAALMVLVQDTAASTGTKTLQGGARVKTQVSDTLQGGARVRLAKTDTLTGGSRVRTTGTAALAGGLRVRLTQTQDLAGGARVKTQTTQDLAGGARVKVSTEAPLAGGARVKAPVSSDLIGGLRVKADTGSAALTGGLEVRIVTTETIDLAGGARVKVATEADLAGGLRVKDAGAGSVGLAGGLYVRLPTVTGPSLAGGARTRTTATEALTGGARVKADVSTALAGGLEVAITGVESILLAGGARVKGSNSAALAGGLYVRIPSTDALAGGARVRTQPSSDLAGGARVRTEAEDALAGGLRVSVEQTDALAGGLRARVAVSDDLTGGARVKTASTVALAGGLEVSTIGDVTITLAGGVRVKDYDAGTEALAGGALVALAPSTVGLTGGLYVRIPQGQDLAGGARVKTTPETALVGGARVKGPVITSLAGGLLARRELSDVLAGGLRTATPRSLSLAGGCAVNITGVVRTIDIAISVAQGADVGIGVEQTGNVGMTVTQRQAQITLRG